MENDATISCSFAIIEVNNHLEQEATWKDFAGRSTRMLSFAYCIKNMMKYVANFVLATFCLLFYTLNECLVHGRAQNK